MAAVTENIMSYLKREATLFDAELELAIPRGKQPWEVYGLIWEHVELGGKRLRPVMCKLACEAVGGDGQKAVPAGAAIEIFHNFTLIHDDLEDNSDMRRGKPCLYKTYGVPLAINAGDGLFMMVWPELLKLDLPAEKILSCQRVLNAAFTEVLEGQAVELNWYRTKSFSIAEADYFRMVGGKTGALMRASCEVGAIVGGAPDEKKKVLADFGHALGLSFQIQDDVLNLAGSEAKYGKEIGGDISEGKRSLITIHALAHASKDDAKRLQAILASCTKEKKEIAEAIRICRETGSIAYASEKAREIIETAKEGLMILNNNEASRRLLQLADFFIYREV